MSPARNRPRRPDAGVAFILVIGVLAGLLVLAAPFLAIALNDREAARRTIAEAEVAAHADGVQKYARYVLEKTNATVEESGGSGVLATPKWDVPEEFAVPLDPVDAGGKPLKASDGGPLLVRGDPRGMLLDLTVRDEQSLPNLWTSPPFLIAAYLGRGTLTEDVEPDATELSLDTGDGFPLKNGALLVDGERITYAERVGGTFRGLARASPPSGRARKLRAETYVLDDRAREIAMLPWKSPRSDGAFREPLSATAAKEIVLAGSGVLTPTEVDRLARNFNTASYRYVNDGFGLARTLVSNADPTTADLTDGFKIRVESSDGINAGSVVRITDGVNVDYGYVLRAQRGGGATLTLIEPTKNVYLEGRTQVAPLVRNPVNVNACSEDTLRNLIVGVQLSFGNFGRGSQQRVSTANAKFFVDEIVAARPIKGWDELRNVLQKTVETWIPPLTDATNVACIMRNAVDANDWTLSNGTVPFSFRSFDYYRTEAAASKNDPSGNELARRRVRELVRVAPPISQVVRLDSQEEFEESILASRWSPYFTTYPNAVESYEFGADPPYSRIGRMLLYSSTSGASKQSGVFAHKTEGDVRLAPARMNELGGYAEHFDGQMAGQPSNIPSDRVDPDGWVAEAGSFELPLRNPGGGQGGGGGRRGGGGGGNRGRAGPQGGAFLGNRGPNPIKVDFWLKTEQIAGRLVWFDLAGTNPDEQRIQLVKEADGTIRGRVRDRTIPNPLTGFDETAETVFTPEAGFLQPQTWYHLGFGYRGTKPDDLSLWIDGMRRGRAKYASVLTRSVQKGAPGFDCEDLTDWPDRGAAMIGREIVEFDRSGNTLTAISYPNGTTGRGRRGTSDIDHGEGEPVRLLGYSTPLVSQGNTGGIAAPRGGAKLKAPLGPFNLASFEKNGNANVNLGPPPLPVLPLEILDPSLPNGDRLELIPAPGCTPDYSGFQTTGGYAVIVSSFTGAPANIASALAQQGFYSGAELVYYTSRSGSMLLGLQSPNLPHLQGPIVTLTGTTITLSTIRQKHPVRFAGGPFGNRLLCTVFPISVGLTSVEGYFDPKPPPAGGGVAAGTANAPEFVSLGTPDMNDVASNKIEWIRYFHRDTSRGHLLCDDEARLGRAIAEADRFLANQTSQTPVVAPWQEVGDELGFRSQLGTSALWPQVPGSGSGVHSTAEDVVPVVRVLDHDGIGALPLPVNSPPNTPNPQVPPAPAPGWGDSVTLEQSGGATRRRYDVTWSAHTDFGNHGLVSFSESPGVDFTQGRLPAGEDVDRTTLTRLLKFPTGELPPMGRGARGRLGGDVDGSSDAARVDEVRVAPFDEYLFTLWDQAGMGLNTTGTNVVQGSTRTAVDVTTDEIPVCNTDWVAARDNYTPGVPYVTLPDHRRVFHDMELRGLPNNDAGMVQIDDELIVFRAIGTGRNGGPALLRCERGFMNTTPKAHGYGAPVVYLGFVPVSMMSSAASASDRELQLADPQDFGREGGLVLIENELAHYTEIRGRALRMPPALDPQGRETGGLLRGRFGTRPATHDTDAIVVDMPFRHWDRYADRQDNSELGWYGFSLNAPGAYLESFTYEEFRPNANVKLRAFLRTEPDQRWSDDPGRGLLRFDEGTNNGQPHRIDRRGSFCEVRFMAYYEGASFDPVNLTQHEWKSSPELRSVELKYRDGTRVLSRETER